MGKHARKRQKIVKDVQQVHPLGSHISLTDDARKDDEERQLESRLFGTHFVPNQNSGEGVIALEDGEEEDVQDVGKEFEHMMDTDVS
jgi:hypothetical protein